jgi:hypothetical protein
MNEELIQTMSGIMTMIITTGMMTRQGLDNTKIMVVIVTTGIIATTIVMIEMTLGIMMIPGMIIIVAGR